MLSPYTPFIFMGQEYSKPAPTPAPTPEDTPGPGIPGDVNWDSLMDFGGRYFFISGYF